MAIGYTVTRSIYCAHWLGTIEIYYFGTYHKIIDIVEKTYEVGMHSSICMHKCQNRQGLILSGDKIVPAECPARRGTGVDTDLEVKCPSQVRNRKWLQPDTGRTGSSDCMETIDTT
jgi:hypothetical protein